LIFMSKLKLWCGTLIWIVRMNVLSWFRFICSSKTDLDNASRPVVNN
jgi:hypothetical protein